MKHLKPFLESTQYQNSELTENDFYDQCGDGIEIMDELYNKIVSLFDTSKWGTRGPYYQKGYDKSKLKPRVVILRNNIDSIDLSIHVLDDEWYLVNTIDYGKGSISRGPKYGYYKCDQWGGLIKFLKDKEII